MAEAAPRAHLALQLLHQLSLPLLTLLVCLQLALVGRLLLLQPPAQLNIMLGQALVLQCLLLSCLQAQGLLQLRRKKGGSNLLLSYPGGKGRGTEGPLSTTHCHGMLPPPLPIYFFKGKLLHLL